eukprot:symbB.v1.2.014496.t2/scaffold1061.1/size140413/2
MYVICRIAVSDELLQHLEASLLYHLQPLQRELAERLNGHWAFRIFQGHLELGCDRRQRLEEEHLRGLQEHLRFMQGVITQRVALLASLQEQRVHLMLEATRFNVFVKCRTCSLETWALRSAFCQKMDSLHVWRW